MGFAEQFGRISPGRAQHAADDIAKKMRTVYLPAASTGAWELHELSPEQSFYWTMLMLLDWGFSYISVYSNDHVWAHNNAYCVAAMEFVNKYAGWARDPKNSPGAWTALGLFRQRPLPRVAGGTNVNWGFFITQENPEAATDPVYLDCGKSTVQGVWAGFMWVEMGPRDWEVYVRIRNLVSSALLRTMLVQQKEQAQREVERLLADARDRTVELAIAKGVRRKNCG